MMPELELKFGITKIRFVSASPETETNTSQLFLNENNIILINFAITVRCLIVLCLTQKSATPAQRQDIF